MTVRNSTDSGITWGPGEWKFIGCRSFDNAERGFKAWYMQGVEDAELIGCEAAGNGSHGVEADATLIGIGGAFYRVRIIGGIFHKNGARNIEYKGVRSSKIIGATCYEPFAGSGQYNIRIDASCNHVIIDDVTIYNGNGIEVISTATDVVIGKFTSDIDLTNQLTLGTYVRTGGRNGGVGEYLGSGTPEAVVTANIGSTYRRIDGGAGTSMYVKESGTGNTGWVGK
jgi:hypothetical protein